MHNVVAIGNSSGFAEPLEATALQHIAEQSKFVCRALKDSNCQVSSKMKEVENRRFRWLWDDLRDFLAVHYRFNQRLDTPFWRHCREHTDLKGAQELVEYFQEAGPSVLSMSLVLPVSIFGYNGYLCLLIGQQVETNFVNQFKPQDRENWDRYRQFIRQGISNALTTQQAIQLVHDPAWQWPVRK